MSQKPVGDLGEPGPTMPNPNYKPPTYAQKFYEMQMELKEIARLCIIDNSFKCARAALEAADAIGTVWGSFPIEAEAFAWGAWNPVPEEPPENKS